MRGVAVLGDYNFDAKSHQELYDKIHADAGASFAQALEDAWNGFRAVMGNAKAEIEAAYRDAGVHWVGAAGEAFSGAMAPLAQFAEDARAAGVATHHSVQAQQSFYHAAKNGMPPPVHVSSTANDDFVGIPAGMTHLLGGQTDQDIEEQKANEAKREAVRVMKTYRDSAAASVTTIGTFVPPPQVTTQVAETPIQQPSDSQMQYSQQWSSQQRTTSTGEQLTQSRQQQQSVTPPALQGKDDTTGTSAYQPPANTVPRPTPPPGSQPTPNPQPPISGLVPPTMRPPGATPVGGTGPRGSSGGSTPRSDSGMAGQLGRGPAARTGALGEAGRGGQGVPGARGAAGTPGAGTAGAQQRGQDEEDKEHKSAPYLEELDDVWGEGTIPTVAPPVIGEDQQ
ncbi:PPE domain-containing protein [Lentzea sp. NPDC004782]|uniref:PPE domain-containing protein n=1 Tax=Lentzea sp. NPDC004782 TaxID=3154458 RepID=UPI0033B8A4BC